MKLSKDEIEKRNEAEIKAFIENMPYPIGSGKSYNELILEAIRFGQSLNK